jgi:opacity protein-like surface antigen
MTYLFKIFYQPKHSMKQIAIVVFALLCLTAAHAQKKGSGVEIGLGIDGGLPVGNDLKPYTTAGIGGDATLGYNFDERAALLVRGGYMTFITKEAYRDLNINAVGDGFIKLVGRYTFPGRFYVEPQIGYSRFNSAKGGSNKISSNSFTYAAAAGIFLDPLKAFDVSLRYEGNTCKNGINFVGIRFAYSLKPGMYF